MEEEISDDDVASGSLMNNPRRTYSLYICGTHTHTLERTHTCVLQLLLCIC